MDELVKYLKGKGLGTFVLVAFGIGAIGIAYHKSLQIKALKQQIKINEAELEKAETEE
jgi:glycerol uptake facilitator-like aquaporin